MLIKHRIAIIFSLLTAAILLVFMGFVYLNSLHNRESNFYLVLEDRANLVAQAHLEKDELTSDIYEKVIEKHLRKLPEEKEQIIPIAPTRSDTIDLEKSGFSPEYISNIKAKQLVRGKTEDLQTVAIFYADNQGNFIIKVTARDDIGNLQMEELFRNLLSGLIFSILIVFLASWFFSTKITSPIVRITESVRQINASNLSLRLETNRSKDELDQLSANLNEMLDRLETGFEIQKSFVGNASHELKTPLTVIMGEADIALQKDRDTHHYMNALIVVRSEAYKLTILINELLRLTEVTAGKANEWSEETFRIEDILLQVQASLSHFDNMSRIMVHYEDMSQAQSDAMLGGNAKWLELTFMNIVKNALKYSENEIEIKTETDINGVKVIIKDAGIGIPSNEIERITEPFFRASNTHGIAGHGLGLALVDKIISLHGGKLHFDSHLGVGTEVTVWLPFTKKV